MSLWSQYIPELLTDLYELTMAESYLKESMHKKATFSLFIRDYPERRGYFVSAGLASLLDLLAGLTFTDTALDYIASTGKFSSALLNYLERFRFSGAIRAIPEGRIFFAQEPVLEVTAPIIEAQILETLIMNVIHLETLIATKASRCVHAAAGRPLVDFSLRRTQGIDAGVKVARASYIVGFAGTSNILAGKIYSIPVFGTMAHSYITSFQNELDSFLAFARAFPDNTLLLIDTYDTLCGAQKALLVARALAAEGKQLRGVRLDSGDLVELSRQVRGILKDGGFPDVKIMASGSLDEDRIQELLNAGAEIDIFAVGTRLGVSADAPYLDIAYKLVEYDGRPLLKLSSGKKTWVGQKQVYRFYDEESRMRSDLLCLASEKHPAGQPLLETVMETGELTGSLDSLDTIRSRFSKEWETLPDAFRSLAPSYDFPVHISPSLNALEEATENRIRNEELEKRPLPCSIE
jgi:nicotinate phosphoribosyltransferase